MARVRITISLPCCRIDARDQPRFPARVGNRPCRPAPVSGSADRLQRSLRPKHSQETAGQRRGPGSKKDGSPQVPCGKLLIHRRRRLLRSGRTGGGAHAPGIEQAHGAPGGAGEPGGANPSPTNEGATPSNEWARAYRRTNRRVLSISPGSCSRTGTGHSGAGIFAVMWRSPSSFFPTGSLKWWTTQTS